MVRVCQRCRGFWWAAAGCVLLAAGCDAPVAQFELNLPYVRKWELQNEEPIARQRLQEVADVMAALFGTPDDPAVIEVPDMDVQEVIDLEQLELAAGPVVSDAAGAGRGLYRRHCVHCHGISGDGAGPTAAFLNPYPRDFRRGIFKFKSTPKGVKPTDDDLRRTLQEGIPGTAMPSFKLLTDVELDALIEYVKYLSIRGEVERLVIEEAADLFEDETLDISAANLVEDKLASVVGAWASAESQRTPIAPRPTTDPNFDMAASIERGRQLYYGAIANCVKCHGETQLGDGERTDYDDWAKDFYDWTTATDPEQRQEMIEQYVALGGLPPRNIFPRNLRQGVYRGGRRPGDIYWRIHNGIDGTPMPAVPLRPPGAGPEVPGLTTDDIWDLVHFVLYLPYESLSRRQSDQASVTIQRERL